MAERQVLGWGTQNAPADRTTAQSEVFTILAINATFDGTSAASNYLPAVEIISDAGQVVARQVTDAEISSGVSAEVTFAPFLRKGTQASPQPGSLLDVVQNATDITVTSTDHTNPTTLITGNPISLDGVSKIRIDFGAAAADVDQRGLGTPGALLIDLYDGTTEVGVMADQNASAGAYVDQPLYASTVLTPSAGTHTYKITAFKNNNGPNVTGPSHVFGFNIAADASPLPMYYSVTRMT